MQKLITTFSVLVILLAGLFAVWQYTAPCDTLQTFMPYAASQNRCVEQVDEASSSNIVSPPTSNQVEAALNKFRTEKGLAKFNTEVPALDKAAQARAEGMCKTNDWSHNLDWQVLDQYYSYTYAGENLYYGSLRKDQTADAITTWAHSPSHLENMVADYTQVGIGVKSCPGFQGDAQAVIITNYFGVPR